MIFFRTSIERTHARIKAEVHANAYPKCIRSFVSGWGPTDQNRWFKLYITYLRTRSIHFLYVYNYISFACSLRIPIKWRRSLPIATIDRMEWSTVFLRFFYLLCVFGDNRAWEMYDWTTCYFRKGNTGHLYLFVRILNCNVWWEISNSLLDF